MSSCKIVIVEDDPETLEALVTKANKISGYEVTAAASTVAEAMAAIEPAAPDILLCDLGLPDGDGVDIIRQVATRFPTTRILVISILGDENRVLRAIEAGAHGYLLKDDSSEDIGGALNQLRDGGSPLSPQIARFLIRRFQHPAPGQSAIPSDPESDVHLSERELEVLKLAAKGFSYQETADLLGVSINTIGTYTKRIYTKLAVRSRSEAVFEASRLGLMQQGSTQDGPSLDGRPSPDGPSPDGPSLDDSEEG